jgi:hypothetical protein
VGTLKVSACEGDEFQQRQESADRLRIAVDCHIAGQSLNQRDLLGEEVRPGQRRKTSNLLDPLIGGIRLSYSVVGSL